MDENKEDILEKIKESSSKLATDIPEMVKLSEVIDQVKKTIDRLKEEGCIVDLEKGTITCQNKTSK